LLKNEFLLDIKVVVALEEIPPKLKLNFEIDHVINTSSRLIFDPSCKFIKSSLQLLYHDYFISTNGTLKGLHCVSLLLVVLLGFAV